MMRFSKLNIRKVPSKITPTTIPLTKYLATSCSRPVRPDGGGEPLPSGPFFMIRFNYNYRFTMPLIKIIVASLLACLVLSNIVKVPAKDQSITVQGNINQTTQITIPIKHLVSVTVSDEKFKKNLVFFPNRFRLQETKRGNQLIYTNKTLLEELRTPYSSQYNQVFELGPYIVVFKLPNLFIVYEEQESSLHLKNHFQIAQLTHRNVRFVRVSPTLLVDFISRDKYVSIAPQGHKVSANIFNTTSVVFPYEHVEQSLFTLVYFNKGFYTLLNGPVPKLTSNTSTPCSYKLNETKVIHTFSTDNRSTVAWLVDKELGLLWAKFQLHQIEGLPEGPSNKQYIVKDQPLLLIQQSGCYQLDIKKQQYETKVLLTCASYGDSFFIKAFFAYKGQKPTLLKQLSPHIEPCKTKRFIFYQDQILSLEKQTIDIFMPSIYRGEKDLFYIKSWMNLEGHSPFAIHEDLQEQVYFYSIHNATLVKSELTIEEYSLQIRSDKQLNGKFDLSVEYVCSNDTKVKEICDYNTSVQIYLHNKNLSYVQSRSVNLAIILLLLTTILALSVICYRKYKRIEEKAIQQLKSLTNPKDYQL